MAIGNDKFNTTTAAGAVGQWRQFSGAMQQLQDSKGAMTQVVAPKFDPEEFNLAGSLLDVMEAAQGSYEDIRKVADKNAKEWAAGKSFDEVATEMRENNVPFQYDPFAMASLATIQGKNAFEIGMLEFQERLNSAEFVDKSPEEIDQIFIERQREVLKELGEAHGSIGNSGAFMNGFWSNANKTREYVWKTSETVKNDYHKQQGLVAAETQIHELLDGSVDDLHSGMGMIVNSGLIGRTPEDSVKLATSALEALSNHKDGAAKLKQIADRQVPGLQDGVTYRSLFGDASLNSAIVKAENVRTISDFEQYRALTDEVSNMYQEGNIVGLRSLQQTLAEQAGGQSTKATDLIQGVIDKYEKDQAKKAAASTDIMKEHIKVSALSSHALGVLSGVADPDDSPAGKKIFDPNTGDSWGTPSHEMLQGIYKEHFLSGNLTPENIDNMLYDPDGQKMFKDLFGHISGSIKSDIKAVASGHKTPDTIKEPDGFKQIMSYIQRDPKKISGIIDYDQAESLDMLSWLSSGYTIQEYVIASAAFEKKDTKYKLEQSLPIRARDAVDDNSMYETMFVRRLALAKIATGKDPSTAIQEAKEDFKNTQYAFTYQSPHEDEGIFWDSSRDEVKTYIPHKFYQQFPHHTPGQIDDELTKFIASAEKDSGEADLYFEYDPVINGVRVYKPGFTDSFVFTKDSIIPSKVRYKVNKEG